MHTDTNLKLNEGYVSFGEMVFCPNSNLDLPIKNQYVRKLANGLYYFTNSITIKNRQLRLYFRLSKTGKLMDVRIGPPISIFDGDKIDMKEYYEFINWLQGFAITELEKPDVIENNRLYWRFNWGEVSVPEPGIGFSGAFLHINYNYIEEA